MEAIKRCYGSSTTESALINVWKRQLSKNIKIISSTLEAGGDPAAMTLYGLSGKEKC